MSSAEWIGIAVTGYVSVPLASLAVRKGWPGGLKFGVAFAIAWGIAAASVAVSGEPFTFTAVSAAFGAAFAVQQLTWHLSLPGAGSPGVNEALLSVGSPPEAEPPHPG